MADLDHHPGKCLAGSDWPVQLTRGHVVAMKGDRWRLCTGLEHHGALGINMFGKSDKYPISKLLPFIRCLTPEQQKILAGNAMHL
eukprot:895971-Pyramimonas_sp.AAC.1